MAASDWPTHLWIIRHGQSAGNVARDLAEDAGVELIELATRDADVPLSDLGQQQSMALARWFEQMPHEQRPELLLVSPFVRARQTGDAVVRALGLEADAMCVDERLREKEFGVLDRFTRQGIHRRFPELAEQRKLVGKFYFRPPGGESWCDVVLRLRSVLEMLRRDARQRRVAIIAHQVIVNCFRYLLEQLDEQRLLAIDRQADVPNCGITEYRCEPKAAATQSTMRLVHANLTLPLEQTATPITRESDQPGGPR